MCISDEGSLDMQMLQTHLAYSRKDVVTLFNGWTLLMLPLLSIEIN